MMIIPDKNNSFFRLAFDFVNQTSEHLFLTGKAGTGKTTFLKYVCEHTYKKTIVTAPTGVAAINAGGTTLHSLFQLPFEPYLPGISTATIRKKFFRFSKRKVDLLNSLDLLIIDEVSMLRADMLDAVDITLQTIRRISRPFGGVQVLFIGDVFQLPPVAKEDEWQLLKEYYESTFFFHAKVIQQTKPVYLELKKVYRQRDTIFVDLLNRIRNNIATPNDLQLLNEHYDPHFVPEEGDNYIILTTHNYKAEAINNRKLAALPSPERTFSGQIVGDFPDYSLPTEKNLLLKKGAQVMFVKNDSEDPRRYYNGKIAIISRIEAEQIYVYIPEIEEDILVGKETWENKRYYLDKESGKIKEESTGSFSQYPLRLAWAITIHKSQGLTFEKAIIDIGASFAAGQAYVALSRCTSLEGIVLFSKVHPHCIFTDNYAIEFSHNEKAEQELKKLFSQGKRKFQVEQLLLHFDWKPIHLLLDEMDRLLEEKDSKEYVPLRSLWSGFVLSVKEMEGVSLKFQAQLKTMVQQETIESDISPLKERCQKAITYFHKEFIDQVLYPCQNYINSFTPSKKSRTFIKYIIEIEKDMIHFLENMKEVSFNAIPLAEDLVLKIPSRKELLEKEKTDESID